MDIELKTEFRLDDEITLRAWRESDVDVAYESVIRNLEHLEPFMHWATPDYSIESSKKFLLDAITNRIERKNLGLGIFRGSSLIGSIGFVKFDWTSRKTEIGYWIDKSEEGKGIITRACKRLIEYAFSDLAMNRIEIRCSAENRRSASVPERLGFKREGVLRQSEERQGKLQDFFIYGLLAEDPRPN
ncbi:MAG TPA: GNAT family N-acetyltransferase [Pyrinomonadaceae bacterium]